MGDQAVGAEGKVLQLVDLRAETEKRLVLNKIKIFGTCRAANFVAEDIPPYQITPNGAPQTTHHGKERMCEP